MAPSKIAVTVFATNPAAGLASTHEQVTDKY